MPAYAVEIEHRDTDQVFSYYHGGDMLHFNVSLLARLHKQMGDAQFSRITMDLEEDTYDLCMSHRGIDEDKVAKLTPKMLREPGYAVLFDDGLFTIIDGHHRLVRRYRGGVRVMDFFVTHMDVWRHCLVPYDADAKAELAKGMPPRVAEPTPFPMHVELHPKDKGK